MSHLALALDSAISELSLTQQGLAALAKITSPQVNRAVRGKPGVGLKTAVALANALPPPHNAAAMAGWLRDQLSRVPDISALVTIYSTPQQIRETTRPATLPEELDADSRRILLWLAEKAVEHVDVRDALASLEKAAKAVL
jgi:hypothetical protein